MDNIINKNVNIKKKKLSLYEINTNNYINMLKNTGESNNIIKPYALLVDKYIKSLPLNELIYPNFRYYKSNSNKNNSKNAFVTVIFSGEAYLPGIFALGYSLRKTNTKHKLICMVQDKDEYSLNKINKDKIDEINKIYDLVIGMDIIQKNFESKFFKENEIFYNKIKYYCTKNNILGLLEYEKIIYLDASCIVNENIDNIFELYNKSTYVCNNYLNEWNLTNNMSLHGNFLFILPSIYNYNKFFKLLKEYDEHIGKYDLLYSLDEVMFYYSIYPDWNDDPNKMFNDKMVNRSYYNDLSVNKEIDYEKLKNKSSVYLYERDKPFRPYPDKYSDLEFKTAINYKPFDEIIKNMLKEKPEMLKYYEYIKTYRVVFF